MTAAADSARTPLLLVEDEPSIAEPLAEFLTREGFAVRCVGSARDARAAMSELPALVLLDWMLPDGQGIDVLREWRLAGLAVPVIFLTARAELIDKVLGLELGADDYVTKPFEPRELLARIKARLRSVQSAGAGPARLSFGGVTLDRETREVTIDGRPVSLTRLEHELLHLLLQSPRRVFTRDEILDTVWGYESFPTTRTVDTHILQLRQKLRPELFESVRGVGYRLVAPGLSET